MHLLNLFLELALQNSARLKDIQPAPAPKLDARTVSIRRPRTRQTG